MKNKVTRLDMNTWPEWFSDCFFEWDFVCRIRLLVWAVKLYKRLVKNHILAGVIPADDFIVKGRLVYIF